MTASQREQVPAARDSRESLAADDRPRDTLSDGVEALSDASLAVLEDGAIGVVSMAQPTGQAAAQRASRTSAIPAPPPTQRSPESGEPRLGEAKLVEPKSMAAALLGSADAPKSAVARDSVDIPISVQLAPSEAAPNTELSQPASAVVATPAPVAATPAPAAMTPAPVAATPAPSARIVLPPPVPASARSSAWPAVALLGGIVALSVAFLVGSRGKGDAGAAAAASQSAARETTSAALAAAGVSAASVVPAALPSSAQPSSALSGVPSVAAASASAPPIATAIATGSAAPAVSTAASVLKPPAAGALSVRTAPNWGAPPVPKVGNRPPSSDPLDLPPL